ncbi:ATP-binding protein [Myxosarcina sp. GI1(2024)]
MESFSILVVEDSASDADLLHRTFLKAGKSQWSLKIVERLREGINLAKVSHFDIVLLDLSLPDSDGLDTVESFINAVPNLPVIILTAASDEELAIAAIGKGAQDYLVKGEIFPSLLVRSIRYSIERGQLLRQLVQSNADLEAFNFLMAHDLQTPLRTITSFSEIVLQDHAHQLDNRAKDYLQRSIAAANRLNTLIRDLLTYSRLGHSKIRLQKVDLAKVVTEVIDDLETLRKEAQAEIFIEQFSFAVKSNYSILTQVILNLVTNAIKFVPADSQPRVKIWAERRQNWIRLWVEDNGIGIAPENQQKIFKVFIRLHGIQTYPGTGIGLAFVKRAMERLEGRLGIESELGQGSRFWLELPK